jgi:hypothetical protein
MCQRFWLVLFFGHCGSPSWVWNLGTQAIKAHDVYCVHACSGFIILQERGLGGCSGVGVKSWGDVSHIRAGQITPTIIYSSIRAGEYT